MIEIVSAYGTPQKIMAVINLMYLYTKPIVITSDVVYCKGTHWIIAREKLATVMAIT